MAYAVFFGTMLITLLIGVPIGVCLAASMVALLFVEPVTSLTFITQGMYTGVGSFTLLALPFFIICGSIMESSGISKRLVRVANSLVGNFTGVWAWSASSPVCCLARFPALQWPPWPPSASSWCQR